MGSEEEEQKIEDLAQDAERETRSLEKDAEELGERIHDTRRQSEHGRDESDDDDSDDDASDD